MHAAASCRLPANVTVPAPIVAQAMLQDDVTSRLWALHAYEAARDTPPCDALYAANAHVLLHDEHTFRLEARDEVAPAAEGTSQASTWNSTQQSLVLVRCSVHNVATAYRK